ncbi:protein of unknown function [Candidatus Methylomirabilis oxygeniifera]|uniref:Uncharacterized protein n=1 Tax=Methylomirabilis oxygeniifera TaxID=671143 RepID=D5MMW5_METO1|nr:protein of unknown function [Candidatus Methylomirabilis oxyfera]
MQALARLLHSGTREMIVEFKTLSLQGGAPLGYYIGVKL